MFYIFIIYIVNESTVANILNKAYGIKKYADTLFIFFVSNKRMNDVTIIIKQSKNDKNKLFSLKNITVYNWLNI